MNTNLTDAAVADIQAAPPKTPHAALARRHGVSPQTVRRIRANNPGASWDPDRGRLVREEHAHFAAFGWSEERIAARIGIPLDTLRKALS